MYEQEKWELRDATARRLKLRSGDEVRLEMMPRFGRKTVPVTKRRRRRLAAHIMGLVMAEPDLPRPEPEAEPADAAEHEICRTCRGQCCRNGAEHAFLTAQDLARARDETPGLDAPGLAQLYLSHAPARAYRGSCIFHSAKGCALPRRLRSRTCRDYLCAPLKSLRAPDTRRGTRVTLLVFQPPGMARRILIPLRSP